MVERKEYLKKLIAWKDEQVIKVVTGIRRCGKSTLLELYKNYLRNNGVVQGETPKTAATSLPPTVYGILPDGPCIRAASH